VITLPTNNTGIYGNTVVSNLVSNSPFRRAVPVTFNETSIIESISIYHNGGTGNVLLGVYADQTGSPSTQLGVTSSTAINTTEGWQTVSLTNPVLVNSGQTVWLSWVFQNNPGIRYSTGTPGRAQSLEIWSNGMPVTFGISTFDNYIYSVYCSSVKPTLNVSSTSILLNSDSGAKGTFNISSTTNWSVSDNSDWLVLSPLNGSNNGTITATTTSANLGTSPRTATITVTGQGVASKTITITQQNQITNNNTNIQGNTEVYSLVSTVPNRRAIPVTFSETGVINSISIYHNGGTGNVLLGVYSDNNNPETQLGVTPSTVINSTSGWQTVSLISPVFVSAGQTIWLSWVFQNNPGVRYSTGSPGRAQSSDTWLSGMPASFGETSHDDYNYSVYCNYTPGASTVGNTEVYTNVSISPNRRAAPVTFSESATIESISIYHNGGTGNVLLGVYSSQNDSPSTLLGKTSITTINSKSGWQTVTLNTPVSVTKNQTVWLSWVFENNPGIRYNTGQIGRSQSTETWSAGMPSSFGESTSADYDYSIYCNVTPGVQANNLGNTEVYEYVSTAEDRRAIPVKFNEGGTINSISIYHNGGIGNLMLGVYSDYSGSPSSKLGTTASTVVNPNAGWQTIPLSVPVAVNSGQTIWLAWVFQNNPGVRWTNGTPGRASSPGTWTEGMPATFGNSSFADYVYSIYCTYIPNNTILKGAEIPDEVENVDIEPEEQKITLIDNSDENKLFVESNLNQINEFDFKLYPNPAKTHVNIDFVFLPENEVTIEIIDSYGRTIKKQLAASTSNKIETNQLQQGMYFVRITSIQNSKVKKLIIE